MTAVTAEVPAGPEQIVFVRMRALERNITATLNHIRKLAEVPVS